MISESPARQYVPRSFDPSDFAQVQPLYQQLLDRPIGSAAELEEWLADLSELAAVMDEYGSRLYIDKSCHTEDQAIEQAYLHFIGNIEPKIKPMLFALQKKYLGSPHHAELHGPEYRILQRHWRAEVDLYRDENVPLETEATKLITDYDKISGAMTVTFRGEELTLAQLGRFVEEPDRPTRQQAWELSVNRRLADRDRIEEIFQKLLAIRVKLAANAGLADYREYAWKSYKRFDYTPDHAIRFSAAIAETCVPLVKDLDRRRRADLRLEALRPWDLAVDPKNRPPLRPFDPKEIEPFVQKTRAVFERLSPQLAAEFDGMCQRGNLDLASRKGKAPGGYQATLSEQRQPFIFMNAAGLQRDVETLLHEGGHAFHCLAAREIPIFFLRHAPMEFCEVASMSMELLAADHLDLFYDQADAARAKRTLLEGIVRFLPWMATIDSFQHWIYTHPDHTSGQRASMWLGLLDRFGGDVDFSGYEQARQALWHRQLHLFHAPFYYIEYGIAQLGALQLWMKSRMDPRRALANYRAALKLGGMRTLPELFAAAGIEFDFSEKTLRPLMDAIGEEMAALPT